VTWIEGGEHMLAARRHRALLLDLAVDFILSRSPAGAAPAAIPTTAFEELPA
jgi:hypothetical protein